MTRHFLVFLMLTLLLQGCTSCRSGNFLTTRAADRRIEQNTKRTRKDRSRRTAIVKLELPRSRQGEDIVEHTGFTTSYNHNTLVPDWAAYDLTAEELQGTYKPSCSYSWNPHLQGRQASREDYSNSGWDKGHMVPKADLKWSNEAYIESYYFTNVCPQDHGFNAGDWRKLEEFVRRMANKFGTVYVVCGPIFQGNEYGYLGNNRVAIPDAFFKAILAPKDGGFISIGFVMNNSSSKRQNYRNCALSINDIEQITGLDLFYALDDRIEDSVEGTYHLGDWE